MKKVIFTTVIFASLVACVNKEQKAIDAKVDEAKCRAEFAMHLLENTTNTQARLIREGYKDDLDAFYELQQDTLVSCDSIQSAWKQLTAKMNN
jgi:hypothetical protein